MPQTRQAVSPVQCAAAGDQGYTASLAYADEGLAEHKDGKHLPLWHKAFTGPAHTKADLAERLHELEAHTALGLAAQEAVAAAAEAIKAFNLSMGLAEDGLAEHKDGAGRHLPLWHQDFSSALGKEEMRERLAELEEHVRLGLAASQAVAKASAAISAYNQGWGYSEEGSALAEHKDGAGKHLPLWHKDFSSAMTNEDLAERLHELEAHVRLGQDAKKALSAAERAVQAWTEGWGYCPDKGLAEHRDGAGKHLPLWHKDFASAMTNEELAERLHELEAAHAALAKAAAAAQAYNNSWGYSDAGDKHGKLLPYWHKAFAGLRLDGADYAERLAELAEH